MTGQIPTFEAAPYPAPLQIVEPHWLDYNGHLNMAYYNVLFDRASDVAFEAMGMGPAYAKSRANTVYVAEARVIYHHELHAGDEVEVGFRIIAHDSKRIHGWMDMHHRDGWLAASMEALWLHVAMAGPGNPSPRVAPFPPDISAAVAAMARAHEGLQVPEAAGRSISIRRREQAK